MCNAAAQAHNACNDLSMSAEGSHRVNTGTKVINRHRSTCCQMVCAHLHLLGHEGGHQVAVTVVACQHRSTNMMSPDA